MAVAAPKRRSAAAPAPAPSRTTPPRRRRKPAARPRPQPKRAPKRAPRRAQPRLALVVGRTAATVRDLPDSSLIVRMTRGRLWIGVLGLLLVGIVAVNVVTLSFAASLGKLEEQSSALEAENGVLANRLATKSAAKRVHAEGAAQGLVAASLDEASMIEARPGDVAAAAARLAAAGG